jgi:hypothetical protein
MTRTQSWTWKLRIARQRAILDFTTHTIRVPPGGMPIHTTSTKRRLDNPTNGTQIGGKNVSEMKHMVITHQLEKYDAAS